MLGRSLGRFYRRWKTFRNIPAASAIRAILGSTYGYIIRNFRIVYKNIMLITNDLQKVFPRGARLKKKVDNAWNYGIVWE